MAYRPIWDLTVDVVLDDSNPNDNSTEFMFEMSNHKLMLVNFTNSPNGNYQVTLRGTRAQIANWVRNYYDNNQIGDDQQVFTNLIEDHGDDVLTLIA